MLGFVALPQTSNPKFSVLSHIRNSFHDWSKSITVQTIISRAGVHKSVWCSPRTVVCWTFRKQSTTLLCVQKQRWTSHWWVLEMPTHVHHEAPCIWLALTGSLVTPGPITKVRRLWCDWPPSWWWTTVELWATQAHDGRAEGRLPNENWKMETQMLRRQRMVTIGHFQKLSLRCFRGA